MRLAIFVALACASLSAAQINFLILGDWGGVPTAPYTTPAQVKVAAAMGTVAETLDASFVVVVGDNFYDTGVASVEDPRWNSTFESVYTAGSLQGPAFKWYITAGNHDVEGNVSAQVAYTQYSNRWTFPSLFYTFKQTGSDGVTAQFLMLDTSTIIGNSTADDDADQWTWIADTLAASKADYVFVVGHYPVWSVCSNGPTQALVDKLNPLLIKYEAHYLSGHDHCEQVIIPTGSKVQYHGAGAGHTCAPKETNIDSVPADSLKYHFDCDAGTRGAATFAAGVTSDDNIGAFASAVINAQGMTITHYDDLGNVLYTAPTVTPRSL